MNQNKSKNNKLIKKENKKDIGIDNKKCIYNNNVTNVRNVINVINETNVTNGFVTFVTCYTSVSGEIFGDSTFERILKFLAENKGGFTYDKIAKEIGRSETAVRVAIFRNNAYFEVKKPDGKICNTHLKHTAVKEIISRIEQKKAEIDKKRKIEKQRIAEKNKQEGYNLEIKTFLRTNKLSRSGKFIIIDFEEVVNYSPELADVLLDNPNLFIKNIKNNYSSEYGVKLKNIPKISLLNIEELRKENLNKLVVIKSRVTSLGEIRPAITKVNYRCPSCGSKISVDQNYRIPNLKYPSGCVCGRRAGFTIESREEKNACFIQLEDLHDNTDNPHSRRLKAILLGDLCHFNVIRDFTPGNEVQVTGILKEIPVFNGKNQSVFLNWVLEIYDAELIEKDVNSKSFNDSEIESIKEIANNVDKKGIEYLNDSFAPDVYGYSEIKQALMLQLSNKENELKKKSIRNKSNILLIGDPGIAKTVLCKYATKVSTGAREAVGGGSSAVGITASVVKEEDSMGGYRVEPGSMILAKDLLFIDELNNLSEEDKPKLQEGMSEQRVSINKANLHVQMKVTCGILSVANPIYGHFKENAKESLQEQFNIPSPILNRFDTVFMMRDIVDKESDKKVSERMMDRHIGNLKYTHSTEELKKYFAYVKDSPEPIINEEISHLMSEIYSEARKVNLRGVKVNPRFFESLTRMSCASAKMRLSKFVEEKDINIVLKILTKSQYGIKIKNIEELKTK